MGYCVNMGICASSKISAETKGNKVEGRGAQDMARSFVSKVAAIRMILKNEESKQAFITFMESNQKHAVSLEYLNYYFETEEVLRTIPSLVLSKAEEIIQKYKKIAAANPSKKFKTLHNSASTKIGANAITEAAKNILISLDKLAEKDDEQFLQSTPPEVLHYFSKSQAEVFGLITPSFESFTLSDAYKAWRKEEGANEKIALINRRNSSPQLAEIRPPSVSDKYPLVLVVDDSSVTAKIASFSLQRDGHKVEVAKDGADALKLLKSKMFDLVLTDINIPTLDGLQVTKLYREFEEELMNSAERNTTYIETSEHSHDTSANTETAEIVQAVTRTKKCVIIGMSIVDDSNLRKVTKEAGMNGFLQKPFNMNRFLEVVHEYHSSLQSNTQSSNDVSQSPHQMATT